MSNNSRKFTPHKSSLALKAKAASLSIALAFAGAAPGIFMAPNANAGFCSCLPVISEIWQNVANEVYATQKTAMDRGFDVLDQQWRDLMQNVTAALKVTTKQVEVTSDQRIAADQKLAETAAHVDKEIALSKRTYEALRDYGPQGQGYDPCEQIDQQKTMNEAIGHAAEAADAVVKSVAAAPGRYAKPSDTLKEWSAARSAVYCRPELAAKGFCTPRAGGEKPRDTNPSSIFDQNKPGDDAAGTQYLNYFAGAPNPPPSTVLGKDSPTVNAYLELKRQKDALVAPSINSVAAIKAANAPNGPMAEIDRRVSNFVGGEGYKDFKVSLHSSEARGLLLQYAKMSALELQMRFMQYEQAQRMETALAAMTVAETDQMDAKADAAAAAAIKSTTNAKIK